MMKIGSGEKKIWTCVVNMGRGTVTRYFSSTDQDVSDHAPNIMNSIAAQIYYWLLKRGCTKEGIQKMFKYCFMHKQNRSITRSKYSQGVAKITDEICNDIITAGRSAWIDLDLALSPAQRSEKHQEKEFEATAISYGQIKPGEFEGHNVR